MQRALSQVKKSYHDIASLITASDKPALYFSDGCHHITYRTLRTFIEEFQLPLSHPDTPTLRKPVVCIALPNGPVLAAVCIAVANRYTAAPINLSVGPEQFQADVQQSGALAILTTREDAVKLGLEGESSWTASTGTQVFYVDVDKVNMTPVLVQDSLHIASTTLKFKQPPNSADDIAIVLFTSGTSGTKKMVPITVHSLVTGVAHVIDSWALTPEDVCLNMMPLYHV
jgi:long-subunit acyl-CoA synthetase (AMP-forming)